MSNIDKQAVQAVADLKAGYTLGHADVAILNELARIALASLEAEGSERNPVLAYADSYRDMAKQGVESIPVWSVITDLERNIAPLFTAAPAPVSVPECFKRLLHHAYGMTMGHDWNKGTMAGHHRTKLCQAVEECRDAMLQGAERVSNRDELLTVCAEAYQVVGAMAEALGIFDSTEVQKVMDNLSQQKLVHADVLPFAVPGGNSPVIQDGWVACSERMPDKLIPVMVMYADGEMWSSIWTGTKWDDGTDFPDPHAVTHWQEMPAAPQQGVK